VKFAELKATPPTRLNANPSIGDYSQRLLNGLVEKNESRELRVKQRIRIFQEIDGMSDESLSIPIFEYMLITCARKYRETIYTQINL
jgi:hypothetical protein